MLLTVYLCLKAPTQNACFRKSIPTNSTLTLPSHPQRASRHLLHRDVKPRRGDEPEDPAGLRGHGAPHLRRRAVRTLRDDTVRAAE